MMRRLSVDETCKGIGTCPSVCVDDDAPDDVLIVGPPASPGTVPLSEGEAAVWVRRQIILDARLG
jgi:hypothetical protein